MIIPVSHERETLLRWPTVTLSIIVLCLAAHLFLGSPQDELGLLEDAFIYWLDHAYLDPGPELTEEVIGDNEEAQILAEAWTAFDQPDADRIAREQAELDRRIDLWREARDSAPVRRWGLTPASYDVGDTVTYMFLHAGWLHLIGNLFILYLAGAPLEDVWGRPLYLGFFLAAGIAAALGFALRYPGSEVPLVGASGAVAGLIGAFLVRFWRVKIKFFYFIWVFVRVWAGTFTASAFAILPLWFLNEAFWAYLSDHFYRTMPEGDAGGVAYLAHVGGFVFGAAFALVVKALELEEKHLKPKIHDSIGLVENPVLEEAAETRTRGNPERARELLEAALRADPGNRDLTLALWDVGIEQRRAPEIAPRLVRVVFDELRQGDADMGLQHWQELETWAPDVPIPARVAVLAAEALLDLEQKEEAAQVIRRYAAAAGELPPPYVPRFVRAAVQVDPRLASHAAHAALTNEDLPDEMRASLSEIAAAFPPPDPVPAPSDPPAEPRDPEEGGRQEPAPDLPALEPSGATLRVIPGIPLRLDGDEIVLRAQMREELPVAYRHLRAVGAAEIRVSEDRPYWILDLVLQPASGADEDFVAFRCESRYFELASLVPNETDPGRALVAVVGQLLGGSGAQLVPAELDPFSLQPFVSFASVGEYDRELRARLLTMSGESDPD